MAFFLTACGGDGTPSNGSTLNGTAISYYGSGDAAVKAVSTVASGNGNTLVINLDKAIKCNVTLTGQTSGRSYSANTSDTLSDFTNGIKDIFGMTAIVRSAENTFAIDTTKFDDGEIVVVTFDFVTSTDKLDQTFGKGSDAKYWAFTVQQSANTTPPSNNPATSTAPSSSQNPSASPSGTPAPSGTQNPAGSNSGTSGNSANQGTSSPAPSAGTNQTSQLSQGTVYFNGFELQAWTNFDDALNNAREITLGATKSAEISATVNDDIARVGIDVKNSNDGYQYKEYIIGPNCDWSATMSLEDMEGTTIVLVIGYQTKGIVPHVEYEYVAISVPVTK